MPKQHVQTLVQAGVANAQHLLLGKMGDQFFVTCLKYYTSFQGAHDDIQTVLLPMLDAGLVEVRYCQIDWLQRYQTRFKIVSIEQPAVRQLVTAIASGVAMAFPSLLSVQIGMVPHSE